MLVSCGVWGGGGSGVWWWVWVGGGVGWCGLVCVGVVGVVWCGVVWVCGALHCCVLASLSSSKAFLRAGTEEQQIEPFKRGKNRVTWKMFSIAKAAAFFLLVSQGVTCSERGWRKMVAEEKLECHGGIYSLK